MKNKNFSALEATHQPANAGQVWTRTYQPRGDAQIPTSVPNLVSGVAPVQSAGSQQASQQAASASQPASSPANGEQSGGK